MAIGGPSMSCKCFNSHKSKLKLLASYCIVF